ncbi:MAG: hypothetical protein P9L96_02650 [Candidatus Gygaella obscura]|nr:hypothetical protein [Candidatus Gygaella obscura]
MKKTLVLLLLLIIPLSSFAMDAVTKASPKCGGNYPKLSIALEKEKFSADEKIIVKLGIKNTCILAISTVKMHYFVKVSHIFINGKQLMIPLNFWSNVKSFLKLKVKPQEEFIYCVDLSKIEGIDEAINKEGKNVLFWRHPGAMISDNTTFYIE